MPMAGVANPSISERIPSSEPCRPLPAIRRAVPRNSTQTDTTTAPVPEVSVLDDTAFNQLRRVRRC